MTVTVARMGAEQVPLWQFDDAHPAPDALVEASHRQEFGREDGDLYPGVRAPVPEGYADWLIGMAAPALSAERRQGVPIFLRASFAVACDDPARAAPIQRIPHFDDCSDSILAAVHYLCAGPLGGTSFYRHRSTGFERITAERLPMWRQALLHDARAHGLPPPAYYDGDGAAFARIGRAELAFNRLILYPANCLHSGDIADAWRMHAIGPRLTITSLLSVGEAA